MKAERGHHGDERRGRHHRRGEQHHGSTPLARQREHEQREGEKEDTVLLDQHGEAEEQAGKEQSCHAATLACRVEQHQRTQREGNDEVLGIGGRAQHGLAEGEQRIGSGRGDAGRCIHQPSAEEEHQRDRQRVGEQEPQMNGGVRAAEHREEHAVDRVDAGHLHVVGVGEGGIPSSSRRAT